jgi:hypothetical protein
MARIPEIAMADDKTKRAPQGAKLISLEEDYEVAYWSRRWGEGDDPKLMPIRAVSANV